MLKVDEAIYDTNKVICRNISVFDASERGLLSQNIWHSLEILLSTSFKKFIQTVLIPILMIIKPRENCDS